MAKRTGNSSVNSSIRQQTKSNEEGLSQLLSVQQASLGQLSSIRQLLELSKSHTVQEKILDTLEDQLSVSKRRAKGQEDYEREWRAEAAQIADLAKTMKTAGNVFQEMGKSFKQKVKDVKEKVGIQNGGLKRTVMGALNVGGVFNKAIAKSEFIEKQKALGATRQEGESAKDFKARMNADAEGAYKASQASKEHEAAIEKHKKITGHNEEQMAKTTTGAALLSKRQEHADEYAKYDRGADVFSPTPTTRLDDANPARVAAPAPTPTQTAAEATGNEEMQLEAAKKQDHLIEVMEKIEKNTAGGKPGDVKPAEEKKKGGMFDGIVDFITGFLGDGLMSMIKSLFNPKNLLKSLGKVFAIGMIVGALFEGIMDGFNEYMETGDIGKALIAGLAGIVDFLTFGLFDKDKIKEVIGDMAEWTNEHLVKPVVEFFGALKDGFMNLLKKIQIPAVTIPLPKILGGDITIGPFDPFGDDKKKPTAETPTQANTVEKKSADNSAADRASSGGGGNTTIVNAPVNNNSTNNQNIRAPIRNQDSSVDKYHGSRTRNA